MDNNEIKYGQSILLDNATIETESDDTEHPFLDDETNIVDSSELSIARNELKNTDNGPISELINKDAITGISSSVVDMKEKDKKFFNDLDNINNSTREFRGIELSPSARSYIYNAIGYEIPEDQSKALAKYFAEQEVLDTFQKSFSHISDEEVSNTLGADMCNVIDALCEGRDSSVVKRRFLSNIYSNQKVTIVVNDDIRELSDIVRNIKNSELNIRDMHDDGDNDDQAAIESRMETLIDSSSWITKFVEKKKEINSRNRLLRPDYSIDDIDTIKVESVKKALDDALSFKTLKESVLNQKDRMCVEFWKAEERKSSIKNWITALKNDPTTFYTLPSNDDNTIDTTIKDVFAFVFNTFLVTKYSDHPLPDNWQDKYSEAYEYYLTERLATTADISRIQVKTDMLLYTLSKVFKPKKIKDNEYNRRVLSYTLDIIGKMARPEYRNMIMGYANWCYETLAKPIAK